MTDGKWVKHPCPSKRRMSCQHLGASGLDISAAVIKKLFDRKHEERGHGAQRAHCNECVVFLIFTCAETGDVTEQLIFHKCTW